MRAYRLVGSGIEGLALRDEAIASPRPTEVLVRVHAASLNYRDLLLARRSSIQGSAPPPAFIPLSDGAGEVVAIGEGVTRFAVGDRVAGIFTQNWLHGSRRFVAPGHALGGEIDGMLAEYRVLPQDGLVAIPDHMSHAEAACLPCAGVTAWNALKTVRADETVLLLGTGGVSIMALQIAKAAGARVIISSSSDEKLARARELGADETVNYAATPDWDGAVRALTGGLGVDHVVEVGGAGTLPRSIEATAADGTIHLIGVLTGGTIEPTRIFLRGVNVHGVQVGSRAMFEDYVRFLSRHRIRPVIDRCYGFEDAPRAYRDLKDAGHFGKLVIDIVG
jgi:NADPH:quinone reductase-like Zn-dependent oxidoreductase